MPSATVPVHRGVIDRTGGGHRTTRPINTSTAGRHRASVYRDSITLTSLSLLDKAQCIKRRTSSETDVCATQPQSLILSMVHPLHLYRAVQRGKMSGRGKKIGQLGRGRGPTPALAL